MAFSYLIYFIFLLNKRIDVDPLPAQIFVAKIPRGPPHKSGLDFKIL